MAMASRSREAIEAAAAEIEGETAAFVADTGDLDRHARAAGRGRASARPGPRSLSSTRAGRRWAARSTTRSRTGMRLFARWCSRRVSWSRPRCRECATRLGAHRQRRLLVDARADPALTSRTRCARRRSGFLKTLSHEVAGDGITVNTVLRDDSRPSGWRRTRGCWEEMERGRGRGRSGRAARDAGGVRRPGRVPLLGARRLPHRRSIPLDGGLLRSV